MKQIVAALMIVVVTMNAAPAFAESSDRKPAPAREDGPLLKASLRPNIPAPPRLAGARQDAQTATRDDRSWVERHPVWTGALVGFGVTAGLIYLTTEPGGIVGREVGVLIWGGVAAGVGALAGWSIGRNKDDE